MVGADCGRPLARAAPLRGGHHFFVRSSLYVFFFFCIVALHVLFYSSFGFIFLQRTEKATWPLSLGHLANGCCYERVRLAGRCCFFNPPSFSLCISSLSVCFLFFLFEMTEVGKRLKLWKCYWEKKKKESFVFFPLKLKSSKSKSLSVYRGEKKTTRRPRKFQRPQRPDKCLFSFVFSFFLSSSVSFLVFPVLSDQVKCLYTTPVSLYTHKHMYARFFSIYLINNRSETSWGTASSSNRRVVNVEQGYMFQPVD